MSKWQWRVVFPEAGFTVSNEYINSVEVTLGTQNPLDQLQPATASVQILGRPFTRYAVMTTGGGTSSVEVPMATDELLGRPIVINVDSADMATDVDVFFGRVISYTQTPISTDAEDVLVELVCQSYLDVLDQVTYGGTGLPAQTEFQRITASEDLQLYPAWQDIPTTLTWSNLPTYWNDIPWSQMWWPDKTYRPLLEVYDDTPDNSLALEAYTAGETTLLSYVVNQAMGCGSWLGEFVAYGGNGRIWYHSRVNQLDAVPSTVDISPAALSFSLSDSANLWDIYTEVTAANSTLAASDWDMDAAERYGLRRLALVSPAANQGDLQTLATTKVAALSRPLKGLTSLTMDYNSLPAAQRVWTLPNPTLRLLTGIPATFGGDDYYYIRGLTLRGSREQLFVDWVLLNKIVLAPGPMWRDIDPADTWNDLTTTWNDWNF